MTDPDPYHRLGASARDALFAAAWWAADRDELPSQRDLIRALGDLTGTEPHDHTIGHAVDDLADAGLVERQPKESDGRAHGVRVTDDGYRALQRGATRLDAAATVEAEL